MTIFAIISLVASVFAALAALGSYLATKRVRRLIKYLELAVTALRDEAIPLVRDAKGNLSTTEMELQKLETLIESTTLATNLMGKTTRIALATVTSPIVELKSLSAGFRRALVVFRSKRQR